MFLCFTAVERTRVKLPLVLGIDGADYINASYIDVSEYSGCAGNCPLSAINYCVSCCRIFVFLYNLYIWVSVLNGSVPFALIVYCYQFIFRLKNATIENNTNLIRHIYNAWNACPCRVLRRNENTSQLRPQWLTRPGVSIGWYVTPSVASLLCFWMMSSGKRCAFIYDISIR